MIRRRQLRHILARQWVLFTVVLFSGFALLTILLLFMLEDSFIDQRLNDVASAQRVAPHPLPPQFIRYAVDQAPVEWQQRLQHTSVGSIREFRVSNGQYLHVRHSVQDNGERFYLAYDVSNQLFVNSALQRAWPVLVLLVLLLTLLALALAYRFSRQVAEQSRSLIQQLGECDDVAAMRALAQQQLIAEFAEMATLNAIALQRHVDSLNREKSTLAFLSHELRTPMQSIETSVNLLSADRSHPAALERLQRAARRLQRAANSILWLARDSQPTHQECCEVLPILTNLLEEFRPLAAVREQPLQTALQEVRWSMPLAVAETVIANVLLNAIQHGDSGSISIQLSPHSLTIRNPASTETHSEGFGLGLQIVQRLLQPFGYNLQFQRQHDEVEVRIAASDIDLCY